TNALTSLRQRGAAPATPLIPFPLRSLPLGAQNNAQNDDHDTAAARAAAVLASLPHAKRIDRVAIAPDGAQVAYVVDKELSVISATGGSVHAIAVNDSPPLRQVTWSADSKQIAFLADLPGDVPSVEVWTAAADGSSPVKHAELKGYVQSPRFSPDGSKLAILFIAD